MGRAGGSALIEWSLKVNRIINIVILLTSFGALGAVIYWALEQSQQYDPNSIPILYAPNGPARAEPEDRGGFEVSHQGLSINIVQEQGSADKPADRVLLAPKDGGLFPEDLPGLYASADPNADQNPQSNAPQQQTTLQAGELTSGQIDQDQIVELGQFDDAELAWKVWQQLQQTDQDLLIGKVAQVKPITSNAVQKHQLLVTGFDNPDTMVGFCIALQVQGQICQPLQTR